MSNKHLTARVMAVAMSGLLVSALAVLPLVTAGSASAAGPDLAVGKTASASSFTDVYPAARINDANQSTYWESANNAFPQWAQIDLGASTEIDQVVLRLPAGWEARSQTLTLAGSTNGTAFSTLSASAARAFSPTTNNTVTISFTATAARYVRATFTANTGWPAAQLSGFEVYGPVTTTPPTTPPPTTPPPTSPPPTGGTNLAVGKAITGSANFPGFVPAGANDDNTATYFEGSTYPSTLTVALGADAAVTAVKVLLNPNPAWGPRTQTIQVLGRGQNGTAFTELAASKLYSFDPATANTVTIPVSATVADVRLSITTNSGAPGGQVAEFQVIGTPAANPDLTVTASTWSPSAPVETDAVTASATVKNLGTAPAPAGNVTFYLGTTKVGTAAVGALAAGASATVSANLGARTAGSYSLIATVDEAATIIELNEANNSYTNPSALVVQPVPSSDLIATAGWTPANPSSGTPVSFTVTVKNQGTVASAGGAHGITLTLLNADNTAVATLTGSVTGVIAAGASAAPVTVGTWTAVNGKLSVKTVIAVDANELAVKQANNTSTQSFFVGRGANLPYDTYEAEDGVTGGGAAVVGPNRTVGDLAGEASGRKAVTLNTTGGYVQWTTKAATNTLVTRFSIPDGTSSTLNIYVNGTLLKPISLTSKYAWLYGNETSPGNDAGAGAARHIYDEANVLLGTTVPAGSTIKLQKDAANSGTFAIDFVSLEQATAIANPDPAKYAVPAGFTHGEVQAALDKVRMDTTGNLIGVYLPAGDYQTSNKFQVYGKAIKVVGAGPWFTRFFTPTSAENTDAGFSTPATANGSSFSGFAFFGNYTSRIDGPGKVFDLTDVSNLTIDNVWVEHTVCMVWATHVDHVTVSNARIRNTFADGVNLTNGSQNNLITNSESRATGDDSFALFAATDHNSADLKNNTFQNLTSILTWRAAGLAVYGGYANTFQNIYIADTLVYSGITISSLDFGYPFTGFGASPQTVFTNISIVRAGGHFWGAQVFPAIWVFSASKVFQGIRVSNVDIVDPTYSGIMFQTNYSGGQPQNPVTDTVFTDVSITGARPSGDAFNAKSGYAVWVNEMPEANQGPAVGTAVFNHLTLSNNAVDIRNTTSTFTITRNP